MGPGGLQISAPYDELRELSPFHGIYQASQPVLRSLTHSRPGMRLIVQLSIHNKTVLYRLRSENLGLVSLPVGASEHRI